jgi:hypothetical protein
MKFPPMGTSGPGRRTKLKSKQVSVVDEPKQVEFGISLSPKVGTWPLDPVGGTMVGNKGNGENESGISILMSTPAKGIPVML